MADQKETDDDHLVAARLHSAALRLLRRLRAADESTGLSPARLSVLSVVVFLGPRSITELARIEQVAQPTMSKLVAGLKRDGLVRTEIEARDRRASQVLPTAAGTRLLHRARRLREDLLVELMADLGPRDRRTLRRAADILERLLERPA